MSVIIKLVRQKSSAPYVRPARAEEIGQVIAAKALEEGHELALALARFISGDKITETGTLRRQVVEELGDMYDLLDLARIFCAISLQELELARVEKEEERGKYTPLLALKVAERPPRSGRSVLACSELIDVELQQDHAFVCRVVEAESARESPCEANEAVAVAAE